MRKELLLAASLTLSGCVPAGADAVTTPFGIFYKDKNPSEQIIKHEAQHWEDYMNDPLFFEKYANDPVYACESEKKANEAAGIYPIDKHPACTELKLVVENP